MNILRSQFGQRLRQLRRQNDLTQAELAETVGVSVEFISNLERGVNAPSFDTLESLAEALHVRVKALFEFESKE